MLEPSLITAAHALVDACASRGLTLTTAESLTGGLIAAALTDKAGSSRVIERGFVTYSIAAKTDVLGVPADLIARLGAVSREVALAMAEGALRHSRADLSVAVTGLAGPGGGTPDKPIGLVHLAAARRDRPSLHRECRFGDIGRAGVRQATVREALHLLREIVGLPPA